MVNMSTPRWRKYTFEECCLIQCDLEVIFIQFNHKKWILVKVSSFSFCAFYRSSKITLFSQPGDWPILKVANNQQSRHTDPSCALWLQYYVRICSYMYICTRGWKWLWFIWPIIIKHGCDKFTLYVCDPRTTCFGAHEEYLPFRHQSRFCFFFSFFFWILTVNSVTIILCIYNRKILVIWH